MVTAAPDPRERAPRRARHLIPLATPRRAEIIAVVSVLTAAGSLLLAPAVAALGLVFHLTSKATRWRPLWLCVPAGGGLAWTLAIGPSRALAGFARLPRAVLTAVAQAGSHPAALANGAGLWQRDLPGQAPLALSLGAAAAAAAWGLNWLHTDEWRLPASRPGLLAWRRSRTAAARIKAGGVLTRDGICLGVDDRTGRQIGLSWREAQSGLLVTGATWQDVAEPGFQVLHAAIRRRQPVIAVDLSPDGALAARAAAVAALAGAPFQMFGQVGGCGYEPWRRGEPERRAALAMPLIDWAQAPPRARPSCQAWLADVFAVIAAAPGEAGLAVLDDVARLTAPGALRARAEQTPAYHPRRAALAGRAAEAAIRLDADRATADFVASQLRSLRDCALGRWLAGPAGPASQSISLADVVRQRGVAFFSLDRSARAHTAAAIAAVVALDAAALCAQLAITGMGGDGLAWFGQVESVDRDALAALGRDSAGSGFALVTVTSSAATAADLAERSGAVLLRRLADPDLARRLALMTGLGLAAAPPPAEAPQPPPASGGWGRRGVGRDLEAGALCARDAAEFTLVVRGAGPRVESAARFVAAALPRPPRPRSIPKGAA